MRVLILGGTTEGSALADALAHRPHLDATLSLAGVTRSPRLPRIAVRIGGFGGADGLAAWLRAERTDALVDATHPFAQRISRNAAIAARRAGVPLLRIARTAWTASPGDHWLPVPDMPAAVAALDAAPNPTSPGPALPGPALPVLAPRRVLLTIGARDVAAFRAAPRHRYLVRTVEPPPPELLPPDCALLTLRGPFTLPNELALLRKNGTDVIVTKNSGGAATAPKLEAARILGIAVIMVARPPAAPEQAGVPEVPDWQAALRWLEDRHATSAATPRAV